MLLLQALEEEGRLQVLGPRVAGSQHAKLGGTPIKGARVPPDGERCCRLSSCATGRPETQHAAVLSRAAGMKGEEGTSFVTSMVEAAKRSAEKLFAGTYYALASISMMLVNKGAVKALPHPYFLCFLQNGATLAFAVVIGLYVAPDSPKLGFKVQLTKSITYSWTPALLLFVLMLVSSLSAVREGDANAARLSHRCCSPAVVARMRLTDGVPHRAVRTRLPGTDSARDRPLRHPHPRRPAEHARMDLPAADRRRRALLPRDGPELLHPRLRLDDRQPRQRSRLSRLCALSSPPPPSLCAAMPCHHRYRPRSAPSPYLGVRNTKRQPYQ